jgi:hypothetical protein
MCTLRARGTYDPDLRRAAGLGDGETLHLAHYGPGGAHYSHTPPPTEWIPEP